MLKKCYLLIILTILLTGCSTHSQQTTSKDVFNIPSSIYVKVNNKNVSVPFTDYLTLTHNKDGSGSAETHDSATKKAIPLTYSTYPPNSKVVIDKNTKNQPEIKGSYFDKQTNKEVQLNLKDRGFNLQKKPGKYVYYIHAVWPNCDATYTFLVDIK